MLAQRFVPPIAIIVPLVFMYKVAGMRDTDNLFSAMLGLIFIHALINLPIAVLLMKSFFDDVPKDVDEAAMIDGATRWQTFRQGGAADGDAAASRRPRCSASSSPGPSSCCRSSSPPSSARVPVKITTFVTSTGSEWGFISALGTAPSCPASSSFCWCNAISFAA